MENSGSYYKIYHGIYGIICVDKGFEQNETEERRYGNTFGT
jgi:hypothetical protein